MATSKNPTKTLSIEKAWIRDISRRWSRFKKSSINLLNDMNQQSLAINKAQPFQLDPSQIRIYMSFIENQISRLLLESGQAPNWQSAYQAQSYQRALEVTRAQLISQGADIVRTQEEIRQGLALQPMTATPSLSTGLATQPIHQNALQFLFTRSYDSLKGWTDALSRETRQILVDGIEQGQGIREVRKNIVDRIGVSRSRAELIARTETIQAYQRGASNEGARLEEELGEKILMRWVTARDSRVRHTHANWHGTLATPQDNFKRIQVSPWNCRCSQIATIEDAITPAKEKRFKKERKALLMMERR
jgi:SPP1 gp7 family putative phage head morphogenesis protein